MCFNVSFFLFSTHSVDRSILSPCACMRQFVFIFTFRLCSRWFKYDAFAPLCLVISLQFASFYFYRMRARLIKMTLKKGKTFIRFLLLRLANAHSHTRTHLSAAFHFVSLMKNERTKMNCFFKTETFDLHLLGVKC